ncbi:Hypothetical_protein [Hexamita inflata]|uniref:Hypothetical_protein n=1 Tax=Hexamita inflata TaxID=28002 RepID=A0AA86RM43_9EUKA|nr:Hypothetical protein HINF_LOCUS62062 [Hexamita inflata]
MPSNMDLLDISKLSLSMDRALCEQTAQKLFNQNFSEEMKNSVLIKFELSTREQDQFTRNQTLDVSLRHLLQTINDQKTVINQLTEQNQLLGDENELAMGQIDDTIQIFYNFKAQQNQQQTESQKNQRTKAKQLNTDLEQLLNEMQKQDKTNDNKITDQIQEQMEELQTQLEAAQLELTQIKANNQSAMEMVSNQINQPSQKYQEEIQQLQIQLRAAETSLEEERQHQLFSAAASSQMLEYEEAIQKLRAEKELASGQVNDTVAIFAQKEAELEQLAVQLRDSQEEAQMLREQQQDEKISSLSAELIENKNMIEQLKQEREYSINIYKDQENKHQETISELENRHEYQLKELQQKEQQLNEQNSNLQSVNKQLQQQMEIYSQTNAQNQQQLDETMQQIQSKLEQKEQIIQFNNIKLEEQEKEISSLKIQIEEFKQQQHEMQNFTQQLESLQIDKQQLQEKCTNQKQTNLLEFESKNRQIEQQQKELQNFQEKLAKLQVERKQQLLANHSIQLEMEQLQQDLFTVQETSQNLEFQLNKSTEQIESKDQLINQLQPVILQLQDQIQSQQQAITKLQSVEQANQSKLQLKNKILTDYNSLREELTNVQQQAPNTTVLEKQNFDLQNQIADQNQTIEKLKREIKQKQTQMQILQSDITELQSNIQQNDQQNNILALENHQQTINHLKRELVIKSHQQEELQFSFKSLQNENATLKSKNEDLLQQVLKSQLLVDKVKTKSFQVHELNLKLQTQCKPDQNQIHELQLIKDENAMLRKMLKQNKPQTDPSHTKLEKENILLVQNNAELQQKIKLIQEKLINTENSHAELSAKNTETEEMLRTLTKRNQVLMSISLKK